MSKRKKKTWGVSLLFVNPTQRFTMYWEETFIWKMDVLFDQEIYNHSEHRLISSQPHLSIDRPIGNGLMWAAETVTHDNRVVTGLGRVACESGQRGKEKKEKNVIWDVACLVGPTWLDEFIWYVPNDSVVYYTVYTLHSKMLCSMYCRLCNDGMISLYVYDDVFGCIVSLVRWLSF